LPLRHPFHLQEWGVRQGLGGLLDQPHPKARITGLSSCTTICWAWLVALTHLGIQVLWLSMTPATALTMNCA